MSKTLQIEKMYDRYRVLLANGKVVWIMPRAYKIVKEWNTESLLKALDSLMFHQSVIGCFLILHNGELAISLIGAHLPKKDSA